MMIRGLFFLFLLPVSGAFAQLPVVDAAGLAQALATLTELRKHAGLITETMGLTRGILDTATESRNISDRHLQRFEAAMTKRGVVPSASLAQLTAPIREVLTASSGIGYASGEVSPYLGYERAPDPLEHARSITDRSLNTMSGAMQALAVQSIQLEQVHAELERFKTEIARAKEPQQLHDVQASLRVLEAREQLMIRQALLLLSNLEAVRGAAELEKEAQAHVQYGAFLGDWDTTSGRPRSFLRMPSH